MHPLRPRRPSSPRLLASWLAGLLLALLAAGAVPASAQPFAPPAAPAAAKSALEVGDVVRVTVWRRPELSGDFRIGADGALRHPLYQEVRIAGLTTAEAQARLQGYLKQLEAAPQVVLDPLFRVSVGGEIRQPNLYSLPPETSIAQAIALAGGPTERGRLDRVRLVRGGRETTLDLTSTASAVTEMPIQSGDQIFIARERNTFRDSVLPAVSIFGALAAVANLFARR